MRRVWNIGIIKQANRLKMSLNGKNFQNVDTDNEAILKSLIKERIVIMDGAMGTMIQKYNLDEKDYRGERFKNFKNPLKGNNDLLSITQPKIISEIHKKYSKNMARNHTKTAKNRRKSRLVAPLGDPGALLGAPGAPSGVQGRKSCEKHGSFPLSRDLFWNTFR